MTRLAEIFETIAPPVSAQPDQPLYAAVPVPGSGRYLIAKDQQSRACLLAATVPSAPGRAHPPIRLESLDAQFSLLCEIREETERGRQGTFTVIRCRTLDPETVRYFLFLCDSLVRLIGQVPDDRAVASAVCRLSDILQKIASPPTRSVTGLFAELYLIWRSGNPVRALRAWREDDGARFDFTDGDVRVEVKATSGRVRTHSFSYEQCSPPSGTTAIVASVFTERSAGGVTLGSVIGNVERIVAAHPDLVLKLHEIVAASLGSTIAESVEASFDINLADESLRFYSVHDVPAIREPLPDGVSDVHFRSDLSRLPHLSVRTLIDRDPAFWDLLPGRGES